VDLSGAQNLNIIGTFVVYGLFEHQLWWKKMKLKQAAHKTVCVLASININKSSLLQ
jgi:hypothetical protein